MERQAAPANSSHSRESGADGSTAQPPLLLPPPILPLEEDGAEGPAALSALPDEVVTVDDPEPLESVEVELVTAGLPEAGEVEPVAPEPPGEDEVEVFAPDPPGEVEVVDPGLPGSVEVEPDAAVSEVQSDGRASGPVGAARP